MGEVPQEGPRAVILSVGEELLDGRITDTNSAWLARALRELGFEVRSMRTLGDRPGEFREVLETLAREQAPPRAVVSTGGLGPTADDRVRRETAELLGMPLVEVPEAASALQRSWLRHQAPGEPPSWYLDQGRVPAGAEILENPAGTALGFAVEAGPFLLCCLPGPPREMEAVWTGGAARLLAARGAPGTRRTVLYHIASVPESQVEARIRDLLEAEGALRYGIQASLSRVSVAVYARRGPEEAPEVLEERLREAEAEIRRRVGSWVFGRNGETLEGAVVAALHRRGETLACAESCTAGLLAGTLTRVPGASAVFPGAWVTYADRLKAEQLAVPEAWIREHGAVSAEVAEAMARGARQRARSDWALAVTGIAGPGGGSEAKPVGMVYLGLAGPEGVFALRRRQSPRGGREAVRERSVTDALELLRRELLGLERLPER